MKLSNESIRFLGRHITLDGYEYFSFSGTGFEFVLSPNKNSVSINIELNSVLSGFDSQYVSIYLNERFFKKEKLVEGLNALNFELNLEGKTTFKLIKLNDTDLSALSLIDLDIDGAKVLPMKSNKKVIGFYGDSLTCGYGVSKTNKELFDMESEEFDKSYAYLASESLDMDYIVVARSGIAISCTPFREYIYKDIFDKVDIIHPYDKKDHIDIAVINLGTNDDAQFKTIIDESQKETFLARLMKGYKSIVEKIIYDNKEVKIVLCYNMIPLSKETIELIRGIESYIKENYKNKVVAVEFEPNTDGVNFHPNEVAHMGYSLKLIDAIKNLER